MRTKAIQTDLVLFTAGSARAKADAAFIRLLQRGQSAHQRRLAGTVGAEQAVHSHRNREGHVLQRLHAVGIGLGYVANV